MIRIGYLGMAAKDDNKDSEEFLYTLAQNKHIEFKLPLAEITTINLAYCHLECLPHYFHLPSLKELNLSHNKLTELPECFYNNHLPLLEVLDLSFNMLKNFDREPDCLLKLRELNLGHNSFYNTPVWFLHLCCLNLECFNYSQNGATNYNFVSNNFDQHFNKLHKLELVNSCLIDKDVKWLRAISTLRYLNISNKDCLDDHNINNFRELNALFDKPAWKDLIILKINYLSLPLFPQNLLNVTSLRELYISNNHLSWLPADLNQLFFLEVLDISDNQLVYISKEILELTKLRVLLASGNQLEEIPYFPASLEVFDLYNNIISSINVNNLDNLSMYDVDYNYVDVTESDLIDVEGYSRKKEEFRRIYDKSYRSHYNKPRVSYDPPSSISSNDSWDGEFLDVKCDVTVEEDWDKDYVKNADISWSDNEFVGDEYVFTPSSQFQARNQEVCNEDWMFVDAD
ncbi:hypothetical protein GWI33_002710 [Rhynchophorus ferrugineus]|uniref:Uncharacterized protein n=1 Tax=Rhynchophorus ferrugineus TaxID=354439 RepID=A0A834IMN7_RHYFE|nr:hypothetical protein GWI33_002710 [Rhynchophorus ferrugineus]